MKSLERNLQDVWYSLYLGKSDILDSDGLYTGEQTVEYGEPAVARMNVSPARKTAVLEQFGVINEYTRTLTTSDTECPITESTILWIDADPSTGVAHNHVVTHVGRSVNSISYTVKEVKENG